MKKIGVLFATVIMMMLFAVSASAATEGIYTYTVSGGKATIKNVDETIACDIVIPETLGGYSVKKIDRFAFSGCTDITGITIPKSVTSIDEGTFMGCFSLINITVDYGNEYYCSVGGVLFNKDKTTLVLYPSGNTSTSYEIPNSVIEISDYAFYNNTNLISISIPHGVTSIGKDAFVHCTKLESFVIPNGVLSIGDGAFFNCLSIESISIPKSVISIGFDAFRGCDSLTDITVDESNANYCSEDGVLFNKDMTNLIQYPSGNSRELYVIPNSVTSIRGWAFYNSTNLISITIPNSVTSLGEWAFAYCYNLESIVIPNSVTSISNYAFTFCDNLANVTIPYGVTNIGEQAFCGCDFTNIIIPGSVTSIGDRAFSGCYNLTSIVVPQSISNIGYNAFRDCYALTEVKYNGTDNQWDEINIGEGNECLIKAKNKKIDNCSCNCHKGGIMGFFWKLINFFNKLFNSNKTCACGVTHY